MVYLLQREVNLPDTTTYFVPSEPLVIGEAPRCPQCSDFIGMRQWCPPHWVELELGGAEFEDIVFGAVSGLLVSERFVERWRHEKLAGLTGFEPVTVSKVRRARRARKTPPQYFHVEVQLADLTVDVQASGLRWRIPPTCAYCLEGQILDGWDRVVVHGQTEQNVFFARGFPGILADERMRAFIEANSLAGGKFVPGPAAAYSWLKGPSLG
jgi:hypothetical protein